MRSTERAVLVTNLWYIRSVDPRTLLYTGMTRDGVFLVENGEIVRPVNNFRWNDSPLRVFENVLEASTAGRVGGRGRALGPVRRAGPARLRLRVLERVGSGVARTPATAARSGATRAAGKGPESPFDSAS